MRYRTIKEGIDAGEVKPNCYLAVKVLELRRQGSAGAARMAGELHWRCFSHVSHTFVNYTASINESNLSLSDHNSAAYVQNLCTASIRSVWKGCLPVQSLILRLSVVVPTNIMPTPIDRALNSKVKQPAPMRHLISIVYPINTRVRTSSWASQHSSQL